MIVLSHKKQRNGITLDTERQADLQLKLPLWKQKKPQWILIREKAEAACIAAVLGSFVVKGDT